MSPPEQAPAFRRGEHVTGNVGIHLPILGARGCSTALVHVDPSAVEGQG
jgi:hypothetical protein